MNAIIARLWGLLVLGWAASSVGDAVSSHLPSGCIHSGSFFQEKTLEGMAKPLQTRGDYLFHCEQGLIWHTVSPLTETAIYRAAGEHWLLNADGSTSRLDSRLHKSLGNLLNRLVGGDAEWLQRNFDAETDSTGLGLRPKQRGMRRAIERIHIRREPQLAHRRRSDPHRHIRHSYAGITGFHAVRGRPARPEDGLLPAFPVIHAAIRCFCAQGASGPDSAGGACPDQCRHNLAGPAD